MTAPWPIVVSAQLVAGAIHFNRVRLHAKLKSRRDCELEIVIERKHATRSLAANAYYFGHVLARAHEHTGHSAADLHEFFRHRFLTKAVILTDRHGVIVGEERIGQTTTTLNKVQFFDYVQQVRMFLLEELGVVTDEPDPNWKAKAEGREVVGA